MSDNLNPGLLKAEGVTIGQTPWGTVLFARSIPCDLLVGLLGLEGQRAVVCPGIANFYGAHTAIARDAEASAEWLAAIDAAREQQPTA
jgi:hypothetical protein